MERESFEDEEVTEILNRHYVSIKVDREEGPDIDQIHMTICQALTGRGGWPLTIVMTPEQKPFFSGTYFPKTSRMGIPGLIDVLDRITAASKNERKALLEAADEFVETIYKQAEG